MSATSPTKSAPIAGPVIYERKNGWRTVRVTAGVAGVPDDLVAENDRGVCCLRSACIGAQKATTCAHAVAAAEYLDELDEQATAATQLQERAA